MTYADTEISKRGGKPIELFKFEGTYANYYYTSAPYSIDFEGDTYEPQPGMRRSAVNQGTQNDDNLEVTIDMSVTTPLVTVYGFQISPPELELTIYRYHNAAQFVRYWNGPVENISVVKGTATIRVPSTLAAALLGDVPNVYFQTPCNNVLFDPRCGKDEDNFTATTTISAIDGQTVTVAAIDAMVSTAEITTLDGLMIGGELRLASGERRMIVEQAANVLTINYPFALAEVGDAVTMSAGCDLSWSGDCATKFNNQQRHTGFMFIPPDNAFTDGLEPGQGIADNTCLIDLPPPVVFEGFYYKATLLMPGNTQSIGAGSLIVDVANSINGSHGGGSVFVSNNGGAFDPALTADRQYQIVSLEEVNIYFLNDIGTPDEWYLQMQQLGGGDISGPSFVNSMNGGGFAAGSTLFPGVSSIFSPGNDSDNYQGEFFGRAGNFIERRYFPV